MDIKAGEVSAVILKQLSGYEKEVDIYDIGTVLSVGDNVARVYGLTNCQASELVEFPHGVFGVALNLEEDNVGCVLFGETHLVKEGDTVKR
ncbi:MAG: F0F1 ATP synthase subunit alpha, partial [Bacteroidetes bacterium]|nr:F0F1 ATP synthase subunit alpha [Bacteroidota bacterium]